jgi:hypothetical protein
MRNKKAGWGRKCNGWCGVRCINRYLVFCYTSRKWMCYDCWSLSESRTMREMKRG